MTEKLELQPNEPLSVKVERHRAVYLAAINGDGGANMDQEAKARMEIIRHAPSDPGERDQKMLYVAGYLIASKGSLNPEEMKLLLSGSTHCLGIDEQQASGRDQ
jgi:hypothetical protein